MNKWIEKTQRCQRIIKDIYDYLISLGYTQDEAAQLLREAFFADMEGHRDARPN